MKVSVIIPCYNGEEYIGQTLGSLFDQTRPADEIIVVDDGSTDRSAEIAQSFGEAVMVLSKGGGGAANARNCGADHATGDAIMFLDADDVLAPDVLEHLLNALEKNPEGVVACPWYRLEKIDSKWVKRPPSCQTLGVNQDYLSGWLTGWYHLPCSILWSRTAYENRGGWDPRAYVNDDGDLMMRALADGVKLQITKNGASFYRRMPEEQVTESLSGARFTRKGREAQIYVIHKIAHMLQHRGRLSDYRKPLTQALEQYRDLCVDQYPELSEKCDELIDKFGETHYMQVKKKFGSSSRKGAHSFRRMLELLKSRVLLKIRGGKTHSAQERENGNYDEIRYGLDTWQKTKKSGKKGEIKKPSNPEISVILPLTNDAEAYKKSLKSVLKQEFDNFEVIVTGSKRSEILKAEAESIKDSRVRFVNSKTNGELAALRNQGLKEVRGDFAAFLDPGDEWHPAKLARQIDFLKKAPDEVGLVYTGSEFVDEHGAETEFLPVAKRDVYRKLLHQNFIDCSSSVMIRRTVIPSIGLFDLNLPGFENHDYWLRISRFFEFGVLEDVLVRSYTEPGRSRFHSTINIDHEIEEKFFKKHQKEIEREEIGRKIVHKKI